MWDGSGEAVSSKGLLWEGVIQASVLSAGEGSRGKALEVSGEEGKTEKTELLHNYQAWLSNTVGQGDQGELSCSMWPLQTDI